MHILKEYAEKPVTSEVYIYWLHQIKNTFCKENPSAYFYKTLRDGSKGMVHRVQGKLPDMIHNLRKRYRAAKVIQGVQKYPKRHIPTSPSPTKTKKCRLAGRRPSFQDLPSEDLEENCEQDLQYLMNSSHSWTTVEEKWVKTHPKRMKDIKSSEESIYHTIRKYPALSEPKGYMLVSKIVCFQFILSLLTFGQKLVSSEKKIFIYFVRSYMTSENIVCV